MTFWLSSEDANFFQATFAQNRQVTEDSAEVVPTVELKLLLYKFLAN